MSGVSALTTLKTNFNHTMSVSPLLPSSVMFSYIYDFNHCPLWTPPRSFDYSGWWGFNVRTTTAMQINLPLVVGLASGFAFVNVLLALTWYLCRRSNIRKARRRRRDAEEASHSSSLQKTASYAKQSFGEVSPTVVEVRTGLTHTEKNDHFTPPPTPANKRRQERKSAGFSKPPPGLSGLRNQLIVPSIVSRETSGGSSDTASMYSTASAPIDLHDQILLSQPFSRALHATNTNAPATPTPTPTRQTRYTHPYAAPGLISPVRPLHSASPTRAGQVFGDELLAPEMYDKMLPYHRSGLNPPSALPASPTKPRESWLDMSTPNQQRASIAFNKSEGPLPLRLQPALVQPPAVGGQQASPLRRQQSLLPSPHSPPPIQ